MKNISFLLLLSLALLSAKCGPGLHLPENAYGQTWLHSYEEDSADVKSYRPNTFDFPPSRGRTGFMIQENGTFLRYGIAPTDGLEEQPGSWQAKGKNRLQVTFSQPHHLPEELEIVSASPELIKIKPRKTNGQ